MSSVIGESRSPHSLYSPESMGCWFDVSNVASLFEDSAGTIPASVGNKVGKMLDLSGNGHHMVQTATNRQPILRLASQHKYYLEFNGTSDGLITTDLVTLPDAETSTIVSMGAAFYTDSTSPSTSGTWVGADAMGNYHSRWAFGLRVSQPRSYYFRHNGVDYDQVFDASLPSQSANTDANIMWFAESSFGSTTMVLSDWIDRVAGTPASVAIDLPVHLPVSGSNYMVIGARSPTNDNWMSGKFFGSFCIDRRLAEYERNGLFEYYSTKF